MRSAGTHSKPPSPPDEPAGCRWPFRQNDPEWSQDVMWDRATVTALHRKYNRASGRAAESLLRKCEDGNTLANEGCLVASLAIVLSLLAPRQPFWTPRRLNTFAQKRMFY